MSQSIKTKNTKIVIVNSTPVTVKGTSLRMEDAMIDAVSEICCDSNAQIELEFMKINYDTE